MGATISRMLGECTRLAKQAGPYVLLEIVLPGGTLFALLLYLHRSGQLRELLEVRAMTRALVRAAGRTFDQLAYGFQPYEPLPRVAHGTGELAPLNLDLARQ
ncbi:MAG: hypothetical protein ABI624_25160 [Casimicrobiaceae bacterium]